MSLISEVNGFLDRTSYEFSSLPDSIVECYCKLKSNYAALKKFRGEMDFYGFQNPYYVVKGVRDSWKDPFFRQTATKKKITFDRIQYSIAAHKIAISHLADAIEVREDKKRITGDKAYAAITGDGLEYCLNPDGVYNFSVLQYFPYRGEYMLLLSNLPKKDRLSYRKIVGALGQRQQMETGKIRGFKFKREPSSLKSFSNIPIGKDYEALMMGKKYTRAPADTGHHHRKHKELIVDKYIRKCLGIGYARLSYSIFIKDVLKYYLKKSRFERERFTSIFPGIDSCPNKQLFGKYGKAIDKKEELEQKMEKLKMHEKSSLVGAAAFFLISDNEEETSEMFNIDFEKVDSVIARFRKLGLLEGIPLINKRTQEFLEFLKAER